MGLVGCSTGFAAGVSRLMLPKVEGDWLDV